MTAESDRDAEDLVRRFIDLAWNRGEEFDAGALLGPDFAHHDLVTYAETDASRYLRSIISLRSAFSVIELQIHEAISAGGRVASRWTVVGTHPSASDPVRVDGISIDRVRDGRIVENWTAWDRLGLERQLPDLLRQRPSG